MDDAEVKKLLEGMTAQFTATLDRFGKTLDRNFEDLGRSMGETSKGFKSSRKLIDDFGDSIEDAAKRAEHLDQELRR